ncbi:MAG: hypothetical protein ACPG4Z_06600, partial [Chitinophagales bacterium]
EKTVILSTHIMQEVEAMCDRVIIINKGNMVANDTVAHIQQKRKNGQSARFKIKEPLDHKKFEGLKIEKAENGYYRAFSSGKENLNEQLFKKCVENKLTLLHLEEEVYSLEDVFKTLTK